MVAPTETYLQSTLVEQAKTLTIILESELGSLVSLFDAETGEELLVDEGVRPAGSRGELKQEAVRAYASLKHPRIFPLNDSSYRTVLPIKENGVTRLIGLTTLSRLARGEQSTNIEMQRLEKWCTLLVDKISAPSKRDRSADDHRPIENQAFNVLAAFDVLLRNTRLHGESSRFQRHALKAVSEVFGSEMTISVIGNDSSVHAASGCTPLSTWERFQLTKMLAERSDWSPGEILIFNSDGRIPFHHDFPNIKGLIAVRIQSDGMMGYVISINKRNLDHRLSDGPKPSTPAQVSARCQIEPFQRGDAALLASFANMIAAQGRTSQRHQELKDLIVGLTRSLTAAIDAKDSYTSGHSERVARMSVELGRELGLPEEQLNDIYLAGLLHDIGKIGIRDEVLCKNGLLTDAERAHINEHVVIGYRILSGLTGIDHLLGGVLSHHEQYNGSGYPEGLVGEEIPRLARIISVADSFDAMSSDRPYRKGKPVAEVEAILRNGSDVQWDPTVIDAFFRCKDRICAIRERGIGDSLREALNGLMRQDPNQEDPSLVFAKRRIRKN